MHDIDDPLPHDSEVEPKKRLMNTIQSLNEHHLIDLLWFGSNGTGDGIRWEILRPKRHRKTPRRRG